MNAPERIWAWCFNTWDTWGGYARPNNRHALDEKERKTGAEYIRADLHAAATERAERAEARAERLRGALWFYAHESHWGGPASSTFISAISQDGGKIARSALSDDTQQEADK